VTARTPARGRVGPLAPPAAESASRRLQFLHGSSPVSLRSSLYAQHATLPQGQGRQWSVWSWGFVKVFLWWGCKRRPAGPWSRGRSPGQPGASGASLEAAQEGQYPKRDSKRLVERGRGARRRLGRHASAMGRTTLHVGRGRRAAHHRAVPQVGEPASFFRSAASRSNIACQGGQALILFNFGCQGAPAGLVLATSTSAPAALRLEKSEGARGHGRNPD